MSLEDQLAADAALRRRIEDYITEHADKHLTAKQVAAQFRVPETYVAKISRWMAQNGPLPRHGREAPEVLTSPAEVLDILVAAVAEQSAADYRTATCLRRCPYCRNHLLYLLDTAPYAENPGVRLTARLRALPEVHEAHGIQVSSDQDPPRIRWITS